ncbi:MAG: hypothetical protein JRH11_27640, partial [Deltaproteobacteria bacterium]|nr:hypothetical protein [Deltaproteobacteria bacterium]
MSFVTLFFALFLLTSCAGDGIRLTVELRTDFVPGVEFVSVETTVDDGPPQATPATGRYDFIEGVRIAEYEGLAARTQRVEVVLRDAAGEVLQTDLTILTLVTDFGLRVVIGRDCADFECPEEQKCAGGRCVPLDCHVDIDADRCGDPACTEPGDCSASVPPCVQPVGTGVACLWEPRDDRWASDERCDIALGCVPMTPSIDAGPDTGPVDSALPDGGCTFRSDCPADVASPYGSCVPGVPFCSGEGTRSRTVTHWQCAERTCQRADEPETQSCVASVEGMACDDGTAPGCGQCIGGACMPLDGGERCTIGAGLSGGCRAGACCFGCFDGATCEGILGRSDTQCGAEGEDCRDCTLVGQTCRDSLPGG